MFPVVFSRTQLQRAAFKF